MGNGGIRFRPLGWLAGAACVLVVAGCRVSHDAVELRSHILVDATSEPRPSFVLGHRFGRWLEVEPESTVRGALEHACLVEQTGSAEDAIGALSEAIDDAPAFASLFQARGALYLAAGYPRAAAGDFQRAVNLAPEHARGWYALGHAYEVLGLYHQALEALLHALDLGDDESVLYLSLARVHRGLGRAGVSARYYELALARGERMPSDVLVEVVILATEDAGRAAGVETLRERLESCRGTQLSDDAWLLRALVKELPGEPAANVRATFRALEVAPDELTGLVRVLLTALQLDDPETAAHELAELLAAEPSAQRRATLERCLARQ